MMKPVRRAEGALSLPEGDPLWLVFWAIPFSQHAMPGVSFLLLPLPSGEHQYSSEALSMKSVKFVQPWPYQALNL